MLRIGGALSQSDGSQHSGVGAQSRADDVLADVVENGRGLQVAVEEFADGIVERRQVEPLHHPASKYQPLRGHRADEVHQSGGEIVDFKAPCRVAGRNQMAGHSPPPAHRFSGSQALEAVAVPGTAASEWIGLPVVWHAHVAHFRMEQAMQQAAVHHGAAADSRADGEINKCVEVKGRAPSSLSERRGIDVGIECHPRNAGARPDGSHDVKVLPPLFRRGRNAAESGRVRMKIDGAKGADSDGLQLCVGGAGVEERDGGADGLTGRGGGKLRALPQVRWSGSNRADKLRAAGFESAEAIFHVDCSVRQRPNAAPAEIRA